MPVSRTSIGFEVWAELSCGPATDSAKAKRGMMLKSNVFLIIAASLGWEPSSRELQYGEISLLCQLHGTTNK
jgi:hypothetical protein